MKQTDFGLFDWIDRDTTPLNQLYEERLKLLEAADKAGFFCYHETEPFIQQAGCGIGFENRQADLAPVVLCVTEHLSEYWCAHAPSLVLGAMQSVCSSTYCPRSNVMKKPTDTRGTTCRRIRYRVFSQPGGIWARYSRVRERRVGGKKLCKGKIAGHA